MFPTIDRDIWIGRLDSITVKHYYLNNHYLHRTNGISDLYNFGLFNGRNEILGVATFGKQGVAIPSDLKKYKVLELRRFFLTENIPNLAIKFMGLMFKWLAKFTDYELILSYADTEHHVGTIYRASNFMLHGVTGKGCKVLYNGKEYHDRSLRNKHNGVLKPYAVKLNAALASGDAKMIETKPKLRFVYSLRDNSFRSNVNGTKTRDTTK